MQGRIQDFKLGRGAYLKKNAPSGGRRENFWGISCEKSRFYAKKSYFFQFQGPPPPGSAPANVLSKLPRAHLVVVEQGAQLQKAPREQNRVLNCRRHQGTMLKGMLMIKIIYMCVTRNSCTPTCTPRAQCRRASCLGLRIINREKVFSDYSIIGSLTVEGTKGRCKMVY